MVSKSYKLRLLSLLVGGLIAGMIFPEFLRIVTSSGSQMFFTQGLRQYFVGVMWALGLGSIIFFLPLPDEHRRTLAWLWFIRTLVTLGFMIFYEKAYMLDAYYYFKDGVEGNFHTEWLDMHGTTSITGLVWLMSKTLPIFDSYHAAKVIFSFIGLSGTYLFYLAYKNLFGERLSILWTLGLFPSLLFWSSILGKDPITFFGLGLFAFGAFHYIKAFSVRSIIYMALGAFVVAYIRFWLVPIFLLPLIIATTMHPRNSGTNRWVLGFLMTCAAYFVIGFVLSRAELGSLSDTYDRVNVLSRSWSYRGGSNLAVPEFHGWLDILKFMPIAAFTALFRPLPGEINHMFGILSGIENVTLLLLTIRYFMTNHWRPFYNTVGLYLISTVIGWSLIYGLFSFQNLGTAVRFKIQVLPFLFLLLLTPHTEKEEA